MNSDGISYHFYSKIAIKNLMNSQLKGPLSIHTTHFYFQTTDLGNLDDGVSSGLEILQKLTHYLICPSFQLDRERKRKRAKVCIELMHPSG